MQQLKSLSIATEVPGSHQLQVLTWVNQFLLQLAGQPEMQEEYFILSYHPNDLFGFLPMKNVRDLHI